MSDQDTAGVIAPPPLIYLVPLAVGLVLHFLFPIRFMPQGAGYLLGGLLIAIALVISVSAERMMRKAHTSVKPTVPTTALVVTGPFRFTRNPLYLGLTLFYAGIAILAQAVWALVLLPVVLRGRAARRDRTRGALFGAKVWRGIHPIQEKRSAMALRA